MQVLHNFFMPIWKWDMKQLMKIQPSNLTNHSIGRRWLLTIIFKHTLTLFHINKMHERYYLNDLLSSHCHETSSNSHSNRFRGNSEIINKTLQVANWMDDRGQHQFCSTKVQKTSTDHSNEVKCTCEPKIEPQDVAFIMTVIPGY